MASRTSSSVRYGIGHQHVKPALDPGVTRSTDQMDLGTPAGARKKVCPSLSILCRRESLRKAAAFRWPSRGRLVNNRWPRYRPSASRGRGQGNRPAPVPISSTRSPSARPAAQDRTASTRPRSRDGDEHAGTDQKWPAVELALSGNIGHRFMGGAAREGGGKPHRRLPSSSSSERVTRSIRPAART